MQEYLPLLSILILLGTIVIFVRIPVLTGIFSIPYRCIIAVLKWLHIVKTDHNWSVVYDAKTKTPIDPAYITVHNTLGVEIASMITDINGRFALVVPQGIYTIKVQKSNYVFPSLLMNKARTDGKYVGLYYGEALHVVDNERAVAVAIPMDPVGNDWNQKEKRRKNIFFHFGGEQNYRGAELAYVLLGMALSVFLYHATSNHFYFILVWTYVVVLCAIILWRIF